MKLKVLIIMAALLFAALLSCGNNNEPADITGELTSAETDDGDGPDLISPDAAMRDGLIYTESAADAETLAQWYAEHYIAGDYSPVVINYIEGRTYPYFEGVILESAVYLAQYGDYISYFSVLYGALNGSGGRCYLIDGKRTDQLIHFSDRWEMVRAHKILGEASGELKQTVYTGGFTVLNIADIIGEDREIIYAFALGDSVALVSAGRKRYAAGYDFPNDYRTRLTGLKLDILDPPDSGNTSDTVVFADIYDEGYIITGITNGIWTGRYESEGKFMFSFACERSPSLEDDGSYTVYYEVEFGGDGADTGVYVWNNRNTPYPSAEYDVRVSESGRYKSYYKNNDLYVYDSQSQGEIFVFDSKPDAEAEFAIGDYIYAEAAFFDGDILYYNLIGYESFIGSGYYNAATGEKGEFCNGMRLSAKLGDRLWGSSSIFSGELFYGSFTSGEPYNIDKMPFEPGELELSRIQLTDDGKLIKLTGGAGELNSLTVYDVANAAVIKEYTMESPYESMRDFVAAGGCIRVFTSGGHMLTGVY
ncbi:MAG: hypothetical protein PHZ09_00920 [Eubacteriales bacterium]|nr:hypothetical protein [Eubacteriales bacterium]